MGLSADPVDKSVTVISSGLTQLASMFLSKAERSQLGELAKNDARSQQKVGVECAVLARCEVINMGYYTPMQYSEVKAIAKSIAKWTMRHFTPAKFSESQAKKGRKSKGGGRPIDLRSDEQLKP